MEKNHLASIFSVMAVMCFVLANHSIAQPGSGRRGPMTPDSSRIVQMVDELSKAVSLTEGQTKKVTEIYFHHFDEMKKMWEKHAGDRTQMRAAREKARQELESEVKALLTDEQKQKYEQFLKERQNWRSGRRPRR